MADCKAVANIKFSLNEYVSSGIQWWYVLETVLTNQFHQWSGIKFNIPAYLKQTCEYHICYWNRNYNDMTTIWNGAGSLGVWVYQIKLFIFLIWLRLNLQSCGSSINKESLRVATVQAESPSVALAVQANIMLT